ncbi:MAG: serine hydrolase [Alphaproteobacteria bacterium]|nr:serine hydrolase [Alphaproteobacteria bacterium]
MTRNLILVAALLAALPGIATAATKEPAPQNLRELDMALAKAFSEGHVPGASVAVIEGGKLVFAKGYGFADTKEKIATTADTIFRAGSISKTINGIAAMTLVEAGKLDLNAKVADLAPEVKFDNPWEKTDPLRVAHLLEHTTGWPDIRLKILTMDGKGWTTLQGVQASSFDFVSRWKPGSFPVYNNAAPALAGYLIEKASGARYSDYVRAHVLRPMGMATADFEMPDALKARLAKSYEPDGSETPYQYIILPPAGSLATSAPELAQLVKFFLGRGTVDGVRILSPEGVARIEHSETTLVSKAGFNGGYGLGDAPFPDEGFVYRGHNGGIDSFISVFGYRTENNSGFVLMSNGGEGVDFTSPATQLVKAYLTRNDTFVAPPAAKISSDVLARYAGLYRSITPANTLSQPYTDILGITRVKAEGDHLVISGNGFYPVNAHSFRRADRDAPTLGFVEKDGAVYKIGPFNAQQKASLAWLGTVGLTLTLIIVALVLSVVMTPVWLVSWLRGRLAMRGGAAMRFLPVLGVAAFALTFLLPVMAISTPGMQAVHKLADAGPYALTIFLCSLAYPVLALAGLVLAWRNSNASTFARIHATIAAAGLLIAAGYAASIGWLPAMIWNM